MPKKVAKKTEAAPKARVTVKGLIENGIKEGHTVARILKDVAKKKPESKADESHIKYYSGALKRAGEIDDDTHEKYAGKRGRKTAEKAAPAKKTTAKKTSVKKVASKTAAKKPRAARKAKK